jgi:hypothetical protein
VETYKGFFVPQHYEPEEKTAFEYCKKSLCFAKTCTDCFICLFLCEGQKERPEFREWLKEKEQNENV